MVWAFVLFPLYMPFLADGLWEQWQTSAWLEIGFHVINAALMLLIMRSYLKEEWFMLTTDVGFYLKHVGITVGLIAITEAVLLALPYCLGFDITYLINSLPVSEFDGREFLMPSLGFDYDILPIFRRAGVSPDIRNSSVDDATIISMVELGLGYSILSELILQGRRDHIRALPLDPPASRSLGLAIPSLKQATPITLQFVEYSRSVVQELSASHN